MLYDGEWCTERVKDETFTFCTLLQNCTGKNAQSQLVKNKHKGSRLLAVLATHGCRYFMGLVSLPPTQQTW